METSIWQRFKEFIRESLSAKFKFFLPGTIMGFIGGKSLLFSGLPAEVVTFSAYAIKYFGTVLMSFSSGLATAYAAYLVENHKNKKNGKGQKKRQNGTKAA